MRVPTFNHKRSAIALVASSLLLALMPSVAAAQSGPAISGYSVNASDTVLTISGTNFGSQISGDTVTVDGSLVGVTNWTDTSIQVSLPSNAGPGTITVTAGGLSSSVPFSGVERGFYTLSANGTVTAHDNMKTYGDLNTLGVAGQSPAIQLVTTQDGKGYWILTQNGNVYAFGDATNFGSLGQSITAVGMAVLPSGQGAYVLADNGTVYTLGQAVNYGNAPPGTQAVAIATTSDGNGYWILGQDGATYSFGDAPSLGTAARPVASAPPSLTNNTLVRVGTTDPVFLYKDGALYHIPSVQIFSGLGYAWKDVQSFPSLKGYTVGLPMVVPFPDGTLIQAEGQNPVYLVENGVLHWITNSSTFLGMGYNWSEITKVPSIQTNWPTGSPISSPFTYLPDGTLFRIGNTNPVYVINNGQIQHIASVSVFDAMGYSWSEVKSLSTMPSLPQGPALTSPTAVMANGTLWRVGNTNPVYVYEDGELRHIPSLSMFNDLGFQMSQVRSVSSIANIPTGPDLGSTSVPPAVTVNAVSFAPTPDNQGLWVLFQNGTVATLGDATNFGQPSISAMTGKTAVGLTVTPDGGGYTILASDGATFSYGDAKSAGSNPGTVSLAMDTAPSTTFLSMAYGSFMPHYDGSYSTMVNNADALSVINPTWLYDQQNPVTNQWGLTTPPSGFETVVNEAHSLGIQVWPQIGSISTAPFATSQQDQTTVNQIVSAAVNDNFDGVSIDFEPQKFNGMSLSQAEQAFDTFISMLGPALHQAGKKLMVNVYASAYPNTLFNYDVLAQYADYINIMDYPDHNYSTGAGSTSPLWWAKQVIQNAIQGGLSPSQIIMGLAPYGHFWQYNNTSGIVGEGDVYDTQAASLLSSNPNIVPVWDPVSGAEVFMTNEYLNSNGTWTAQSSAMAQAPVPPTGGYTTQYETKSLNPVKNLQGLLNYILLRYAVEHNQSTPNFLTQDGAYGPLTSAAVALFQQDFNVTGDPSGVYGTNTEAALKQVIQDWNIGQYQYWVDTTQSEQERIQQVALADGVAGVDPWRVPFETPDYWTMLSQTVSITHLGE
ncbi:glycosyl hydrolase family 18 protein [Sulfobacillus harzensis]|uniref:Glycoside hydrolase n=1 Tax=Sulfobacillus harzensis TaxID=2729629 RepID=A0A7Y0L411_9FIRM|nr:glycosyl hydrolase family 18 protein [Sulfobacillus harzensis]NMP22537.1 glycoside hydrolase [Sulfobacillus harzensis]